jgi:hypothetical protein
MGPTIQYQFVFVAKICHNYTKRYWMERCFEVGRARVSPQNISMKGLQLLIQAQEHLSLHKPQAEWEEQPHVSQDRYVETNQYACLYKIWAVYSLPPPLRIGHFLEMVAYSQRLKTGEDKGRETTFGHSITAQLASPSWQHDHVRCIVSQNSLLSEFRYVRDHWYSRIRFQFSCLISVHRNIRVLQHFFLSETFPITRDGFLYFLCLK